MLPKEAYIVKFILSHLKIFIGLSDATAILPYFLTDSSFFLIPGTKKKVIFKKDRLASRVFNDSGWRHLYIGSSLLIRSPAPHIIYSKSQALISDSENIITAENWVITIQQNKSSWFHVRTFEIKSRLSSSTLYPFFRPFVLLAFFWTTKNVIHYIRISENNY